MLSHENSFQWPVQAPVLSGFRSDGAAPVGVFVHGFRSHCDGEKAVSLARHASVRGRPWIRYNQRHCGLDNEAFANFTVGRSIADLSSIIDSLGHPVILVGSSLGAVISLQAAQSSPQSVRGMLLIAPAFRFVSRHFATLPGGTVERWRNRGILHFPDYYEGGEFPLNYEFYQDALDYADLGPWKFDFPVTILHGENDELLPQEDSRDLQQHIQSPSVTLDIVTGGDHRLVDSIPLMCRKLDALWKSE
jgi:hypothetical protein